MDSFAAAAAAGENDAESSTTTSNVDQSQLTCQDIILTQHLIEKCIQFYMDRDECVTCLQQIAKLKPEFIRIVWDELEKRNVEFFAAYHSILFRRRQVLVARNYHNQTAKLRRQPAATNHKTDANTETNENAETDQ